MKNHIIYLHLRKGTGHIFYVGQATNTERPNTVHSRNAKWKAEVKEHGFETVILFRGLSTTEANDMETRLIEEHKKTVVNKSTKGKFKRVQCPHCEKTGQAGPMNRWHFDNCIDERNPNRDVMKQAEARIKNNETLKKTSPLWREVRKGA